MTIELFKISFAEPTINDVEPNPPQIAERNDGIADRQSGENSQRNRPPIKRREPESATGNRDSRGSTPPEMRPLMIPAGIRKIKRRRPPRRAAR